MSAHRFSRRYAIVGAALTPTARTHAPDMSPLALEAWAARLAIADAGLDRRQINGAVHTSMAAPHPPAQWVDAFSRLLGIKSNFYLNVARGGQAAHNGVLLATQMLELGLAEYVVVGCGFSGYSAPRRHEGQAAVMRGGAQPGMSDFGLGRMGFDSGNAGTVHGLMASRHMHEYGTTPEHLGAVAVATREWANLNPAARFQDRPLDLDQYLASPPVIRPFRVADCCLSSDLGGALVITTAERAHDHSSRPILIEGIGVGDHAREQWWTKQNYVQTDGRHALRTALRMSDLDLTDIDVAELYDCFTMEVLMYLEDYGWCEKGEGGPLVASGFTAPGGKLPVNTHGGLLSGMYLFDFPAVVEAVCQLRGEAGERQVRDVDHVLTNGHGGEMVLPGMCASHAVMILGKE